MPLYQVARGRHEVVGRLRHEEQGIDLVLLEQTVVEEVLQTVDAEVGGTLALGGDAMGVVAHDLLQA